MPVKRTAVFDLDGTLADTSADLISAANARFRQLGYGDLLCPERDRKTAFRGGRAMLTLGLGRVDVPNPDADLLDREYALFLEAYRKNIARHTRLYSGVRDALDEMQRDKWLLSVCTNKPELLARELLAQLGVLDRFGSLVGADTLPVRKPDPDPLFQAIEWAGGRRSHAVLVGDSSTDSMTAQAAGVKLILVPFGADSERLAKLGPDAIVDDYADMASVASSLIANPSSH